MTMSEMIDSVNKQGLRINNLFQKSDLSWQANITDGVQYWGFAYGSTINDALMNAVNETKRSPASSAPYPGESLPKINSTPRLQLTKSPRMQLIRK